MSGRLPTTMLVGALLRRVNDAGGFGVVLARGDAQAGAILVVARQPGSRPRLLERGIGPSGDTILIESGPSSGTETELDEYWRKRRKRDPDLWILDLDIPSVERVAAETICID